jgi:hypothetical protein
MNLSFHFFGYEIELEPAGAIVLALFIAMVLIGITALVRYARTGRVGKTWWR